MRILFVHNRYQQAGGEDCVVQAESNLLSRMGHQVDVWEENNDSIVSRMDALVTGFQSVYSFEHARKMRERIRCFQPDLVHIHNFFPRLSPSIHLACLGASIPVVQTLHNFRLLCPGATFHREGKVCEDCMGKAIPWPSVLNGCYRHSRSASAAVAGMLSVHRALGTWRRTVSCFIALSKFAQAKFIAGGVPANKIVVKPNFVDPDPGSGAGRGNFALFVGRLAEEKGIGTLLAAWSRLSIKPRLKIIGDGPLASAVANAAATMREIEWLGPRGKDQVSQEMADASVLIVPSTWYEGFPLVIAEAFAAGLPIVASRIGGLAEVVSGGHTGWLVSPGDFNELSNAVSRVFSQPEELQAMRLKARSEFENRYTAAINYQHLIEIYNDAIHTRPVVSCLGTSDMPGAYEYCLGPDLR
jgi:glycosyltransferase involved in cell wall biosynthesis